MQTYKLESSLLVHAPGLIAWAINGYAFLRDRAVILRAIVDTWPTLAEHDARLLLSGECPYRIEGDTVVFTIMDDVAASGNTKPMPNDEEDGATTEYVVKLRFWLRCWDSMHIQADSDDEAIRLGAEIAREMMQSASFPESIEVDERREGLVSYIDRVDGQGRTEIAEAIEFPGASPLFPEADDLIARLAALSTDELKGEQRMRDLLEGFAADARRIRPDVPPLTNATR